LVNKFAQGNKLLDIGCATGVFLDACKNQGYQVEGIEPNEKARQFANEHYNLKVQDISSLTQYDEGSFDVITMWHVLEHVDDINERMQVINKLMKDDAVTLIALPNPLSHDAIYYKEHWAAYDVPRHLYHFTQDSFKKLANKHAFEVVKVLPMYFDSFYISLLSEKYKSGHTSFIKAAYRGIASNLSALGNGHNYSSLIYVIKKR
jgi:2-polyprenyl-3-methyl-5-hydroxy-6-metoxy-1,4-benzoquinol methylase